MTDNTLKPEKSRLAFQRNVAIIGVILFIGKLIAWHLTNSDAVFSDAMESIVNIISAFMGLYSLYLAAQPKDENHPYGHGKVEFVTSGVEGSLIIFAGVIIIVEAVDSLLHTNALKRLWYFHCIGNCYCQLYYGIYFYRKREKRKFFGFDFIGETSSIRYHYHFWCSGEFNFGLFHQNLLDRCRSCFNFRNLHHFRRVQNRKKISKRNYG